MHNLDYIPEMLPNIEDRKINGIFESYDRRLTAVRELVELRALREQLKAKISLLETVARRNTQRQIAKRLNLSYNTVNTILSRG